ncbi:MAG: hypothetical protein AAFX99_33980, partial [Myxococcota bacterium]
VAIGFGIVGCVFVVGFAAVVAVYFLGREPDYATEICLDAIDKDKMMAHAAGKDERISVKESDGGKQLTVEDGAMGCQSRCEGMLTDKGFHGKLTQTCVGVNLSKASIEVEY